ncbi:MAG: hypothetical protein ACK2UH_00965 [Candidatus Promineifilaceae bacterium]
MLTEGKADQWLAKVTGTVLSGNWVNNDGGAIENRSVTLLLRQVPLANNQAQSTGGGPNVPEPAPQVQVYNSIF